MPSSDPSSISRELLDHDRFLPGTLLAERYRIIGLLGKGGMGEVYRADDLKLGQPVALKFLPESLEQDPSRLSRLLNEVRMARQVSHPNVCRVYDVGEIEGAAVLVDRGGVACSDCAIEDRGTKEDRLRGRRSRVSGPRT